MSSPFFRISPSGVETAVNIDDQFVAPFPSPLWLIGAGPSLQREDIDLIRSSPAPKFCVNLSGCNKDGRPPLFRPDFWTGYDSTRRFHKSIYLDPGIMKFVCKSRKADIIPETTYRVYEAPNALFFDREYRKFEEFTDPNSDKIIDCQDTFVQAIDIAYRLGFRKIFMVGVELAVIPSDEQLELAAQHGVEYDPRTMSTKMEKVDGALLRDFDARCREKGLVRDCNPGEECEDGKKRMILDVGRPEHYSMSETRKWQTTIRADEHYYRTSQYLRMARGNFSKNGLELVCCTSPSRLSNYFTNKTVEEACEWIKETVGDPNSETCLGKYEEITKPGSGLMPMRDYKPHGDDRVNDFHKKTDNERIEMLTKKVADIPEEIELDSLL